MKRREEADGRPCECRHHHTRHCYKLDSIDPKKIFSYSFIQLQHQSIALPRSYSNAHRRSLSLEIYQRRNRGSAGRGALSNLTLSFSFCPARTDRYYVAAGYCRHLRFVLVCVVLRAITQIHTHARARTCTQIRSQLITVDREFIYTNLCLFVSIFLAFLPSIFHASIFRRRSRLFSSPLFSSLHGFVVRFC